MFIVKYLYSVEHSRQLQRQFANDLKATLFLPFLPCQSLYTVWQLRVTEPFKR